MMRTRLLALTAIVLAMGCSSDSDTVTDPIAPVGLDLSISPKSDTLFLDAANGVATTTQLTVTATSMGNPVTTPQGRVFESADTTIVLVDPVSGLVVPVGVGTAQVSVRVNSVKDYATIVVLPVVQSVEVTTSATEALTGDTIVVTATVLGWDGQPVTGQPITFSSDNPSATVTADGRVVFSAPGTATITATSGTATATVSLTAFKREFVGGALGSIVSGEDATCGLLPLGKTFCFGKAPVIGIAKDTACFGDTNKGATVACTLVPLQIAGQLQLTTLAAGDSVACGLNAQGQAYCWGVNSYGQIGNGVAAPGTSELPHLVTGPLASVATFTKISPGTNHVCALSLTGAAYCWGSDVRYQLGTGDNLPVNSSTPIPVGGNVVYSAIAAGRSHTCAIRSGDGVAVCWGDNQFGQLGRGTIDTIPHDDALPVMGTVQFSQISTKSDFTCALSTAGTIYCWGDNGSGQTGQSSGIITTVPSIVNGSGYVTVSAGWAHACALTSTGAASCWGDDAFGQLGNGPVIGGGPSPSVVAGSLAFSAISAGSRSTCAVAADGAYCWGSAIYGATGNQIQALKVYAPSKTATPQ